MRDYQRDSVLTFQKKRFFLLDYRFLFLFLSVLIPAGCSSLHRKTPLPEVIKSEPTRQEVVDALNNNSNKIQSLVSEDGTIGVSSSPWTAKCRLAFKRESQFRLVGNLDMVGPVIDFGSDGELFWFWFKNQEPNQISYCNLSEYGQSSLKDQIPIDPIWLPQILGVVNIDMADVVEGPTIDRDDSVKLVLKKKRPEGEYYEYLYLESKTAALVRQDIKNPVTDEIFSVKCEDFQYDSEHGVVLPKKVIISRSMAKERFFVDLGTLQVNSANSSLTFTLPKSEELGVPLVNIGPNAAAPAPSASGTPASSSADLTASSIPVEVSEVDSSAASAASSGGWGTGDAPSGSTYQSIYPSSSAPGVPAVREIPLQNAEELPETPSSTTYSGGSVTTEFTTVVSPNSGSR